MGIVIGPFDASTWLTLGMLKQDMDYMRRKDRVKYDLAIKKQKEVYDELLAA